MRRIRPHFWNPTFMPSAHKGLVWWTNEKQWEVKSLLSFLAIQWPLFQLPPFDLTVHSVTMTPTLQYRKQPDLHKSDFFLCCSPFLSPSTEGYIPALLEGFQCSVHREKDSGVCACLHRHVKKYSENYCLKFLSSFFLSFHLIKFKSCLNPDISITYWIIHGAENRKHQSPPWQHCSRSETMEKKQW